MDTTYIKLIDFVEYKQIDMSFIDTLTHSGLIELIVIDNQPYVDELQLGSLEKFVSLHYELEINPAGIEVVHTLLQKIEQLQLEVAQLNSKVKHTIH